MSDESKGKRTKTSYATTRNNARARGDKRITQRATKPSVDMHVDRVIELTMLGNDIKTIAEKLALKPTTVRDLRQRADYKERYQMARDEAMRLTIERVHALQLGAIAAHMDVLTAKRRTVEVVGADAAGRPLEKIAEDYKYPARDRLRAAESILDRTGVPRQTKVEQAGEITVSPHIDMSPFDGRTIEEKRHYLEHGVFPDGSKPVAQ